MLTYLRIDHFSTKMHRAKDVKIIKRHKLVFESYQLLSIIEPGDFEH